MMINPEPAMLRPASEPTILKNNYREKGPVSECTRGREANFTAYRAGIAGANEDEAFF